MICDVSHKTLYRYSAPVVQSQHLIHMSPRTVAGQTIRHHSLLVEPAPSLRIDGTDTFGNPTVMLEIEVPHREFVLHSRSSIETQMPAVLDFSASSPWDQSDGTDATAGELDLGVIQYKCATRLTMPTLEIASYGRECFAPGRPVLDGTMELMLRIVNDFAFDPTATDISTPLAQMFKQRRGVCQDFSHLSLACLRALRIPARYVSGYILTRPPPGQTKLQGTDASHAWISVWCRGIGWVDFDPTNGLAVKDEHITIAHGRDYDDVSPISGVLLGGGEHTVSVSVDVVAAP